MLYYVILDAVCLVMFLAIMNSKSVYEEILVPEDFDNKTDKEKAEWIDGISRQILKKWFFEESDDICENLRGIISNPDHPDNYWISNMQDDGRFKFHHCNKTYKYSNTLQYHEKNIMMSILKSQSQSKVKVAQMKLTSTYLCYFG